MGYPQRPTALHVVNGWYLELPGLNSPQFETLEGLSKKTGTVQIVDGGSNIVHKFNDQIIDFGQITLSRTSDGSSDDIALDAMVDLSIRTGVQYVGALVKMHFGVEIYRIMFLGMGFKEINLPSLDINSGEKHRTSYMATIIEWVKI